MRLTRPGARTTWIFFPVGFPAAGANVCSNWCFSEAWCIGAEDKNTPRGGSRCGSEVEMLYSRRFSSDGERNGDAGVPPVLGAPKRPRGLDVRCFTHGPDARVTV